LIFIVGITSIALLYQIYHKKSIIIEEDGIKFSYRNNSKKIQWANVLKIIFVYEEIMQKNSVKLVKIKTDKYRFIRINTSAFENENELIASLQKVKSKYNL